MHIRGATIHQDSLDLVSGMMMKKWSHGHRRLVQRISMDIALLVFRWLTIMPSSLLRRYNQDGVASASNSVKFCVIHLKTFTCILGPCTVIYAAATVNRTQIGRNRRLLASFLMFFKF